MTKIERQAAKKKMKIRMACEWKNLGRFVIDHFAISRSSESQQNVPQAESVEPVHRHYLTCYFKAATYSESFNKNGYCDNLNSSGQVFPFAEASVVMDDVLQKWDCRLVYPYSKRLSWIRDADAVAGFKMRWEGTWKRDSVQQRFRREWLQSGDEAFYKPRKNSRLYEPHDFVPDWDPSPTTPFIALKQLSIASKNGTTEEITRELMMEFLYRFVMTFDEGDLRRIFKLTFRLDEETGKESDFGVEISLKGFVDVVVNSWERQLILMYANDIGWGGSLRFLELNSFIERMNKLLDHGIPQLPTTRFDDYPKRVRRTIILRSIRGFFSQKHDWDNGDKRGDVPIQDSELRAKFIRRIKGVVDSISELRRLSPM